MGGVDHVMAKLTPKQSLFVDEYLIDLNATAAYKRAGYKAKGNAAEVNAARLLRNAKVQEALNERMKERQQRTEVTQDNVIKELAKIAFSDLKDFVRWDERGVDILDSEDVDGTVLAEISETVNIQVFPNGGESEKRQKKVKPHDKMKALELLGKHLGMFTDKVEHSGSVTTTNIDMSSLSIEELRALAKLDE